jgi:hypothetical protein
LGLERQHRAGCPVGEQLWPKRDTALSAQGGENRSLGWHWRCCKNGMTGFVLSIWAVVGGALILELLGEALEQLSHHHHSGVPATVRLRGAADHQSSSHSG